MPHAGIREQNGMQSYELASAHKKRSEISFTKREKVSQRQRKRKNPWLLGKMLESGFPDASGREEG
jgi:hypothetical protein